MQFVTAAVLGNLPRDALRLAAILAAVLLVPVVLTVIAVAALIAALLSGSPGAGRSDPPSLPPEQLEVMVQVSARSGVPWSLLAAIASVESSFGANMATSSAGAIGYGQFLPSSWDAYGAGGDPYDYHDAIPAMARYLADHGVGANVAQAVYAYNHSWEYVALVLGRAAHYASVTNVPPALAAGVEP